MDESFVKYTASRHRPRILRRALSAVAAITGGLILTAACAAGVSALFYGRRKKREAARQCAVPEREETQKEKMASVSSGMQLPPGFKMPF